MRQRPDDFNQEALMMAQPVGGEFLIHAALIESATVLLATVRGEA